MNSFNELVAKTAEPYEGDPATIPPGCGLIEQPGASYYRDELRLTYRSFRAVLDDPQSIQEKPFAIPGELSDVTLLREMFRLPDISQSDLVFVADVAKPDRRTKDGKAHHEAAAQLSEGRKVYWEEEYLFWKTVHQTLLSRDVFKEMLKGETRYGAVFQARLTLEREIYGKCILPVACLDTPGHVTVIDFVKVSLIQHDALRGYVQGSRLHDREYFIRNLLHLNGLRSSFVYFAVDSSNPLYISPFRLRPGDHTAVCHSRFCSARNAFQSIMDGTYDFLPAECWHIQEV